MATIVLWTALQFALVLGAMLLAGSAAWRRRGSFALVALALWLPLLSPLAALPRALLACLAVLALVKVAQVCAAPEQFSRRLRLWHAWTPFDVQGTQRVPPGLDRALLTGFLLYGGVALAVLLALAQLPRVLSPGTSVLRLLLGVALVYSGMEAITLGTRLAHRLAGIAVPPMQQMPIAALSIREFWSERWNRPVSGWLNHFVFLPVSRRQGAEIAIGAAFALSALLHAWIFFVAAGWLMAVMAGAFFLFHALFLLVESAIRVRKLARWQRRAWTLGLLLLSSPLFVIPVLAVLGV